MPPFGAPIVRQAAEKAGRIAGEFTPQLDYQRLSFLEFCHIIIKLMDAKLTLSVVVPVYNEVDQLPHCLDSLLAQSEDILEIIVVDNNSTDGSIELARNYASKYTFIKIVREKKQGLVPARNRGFLESSGDIIARIDADTRVCTGWAVAIKQYFVTRPAIQAISGETRYYDLPFERITAKLSDLIIRKYNRLVAGFESLYGPNMALRSQTAKTLTKSTCSGSINEDVDLTIHLREKNLLNGYSSSMLAYISGRRLKTSPLNFYRWCLNWSRTFFRHKRYLASFLVYSLCLIICLTQTIGVIPLRVYYSLKDNHGWRQALRFSDDRIIP